MVTRRRKGYRQAAEQIGIVVVDLGSLAMHDFLGMHDAPAEGLAYTLMAQADAQQGQFSLKMIDDIDGYPRLVGGARPGRNHDPRRVQILDFLQANLVVAENAHVFTQFAEILHQVVGEGIVIIDH